MRKASAARRRGQSRRRARKSPEDAALLASLQRAAYGRRRSARLRRILRIALLTAAGVVLLSLAAVSLWLAQRELSSAEDAERLAGLREQLEEARAQTAAEAARRQNAERDLLELSTARDRLAVPPPRDASEANTRRPLLHRLLALLTDLERWEELRRACRVALAYPGDSEDTRFLVQRHLARACLALSDADPAREALAVARVQGLVQRSSPELVGLIEAYLQLAALDDAAGRSEQAARARDDAREVRAIGLERRPRDRGLRGIEID